MSSSVTLCPRYIWYNLSRGFFVVVSQTAVCREWWLLVEPHCLSGLAAGVSNVFLLLASPQMQMP